MAVEIISEYGSQLDCHTCDDTLKKERGHDERGIVPFWVDGKQVFRCPLTFITPLSWEYIKAFSFYEKNILPNGVGWMNESNKFNQAMQILDNAFNKSRNELNNKEIEKYARNRT